MFGHTDNQQDTNGQQMPANGQVPQPAAGNPAPQQSYDNSQIPAGPDPVQMPQNPYTTPAEPQSYATPSSMPPAVSSDADTAESDADLLDIKQKALQELSPLVNHLDQSAEEKFKTTMMMIQASDDQALLPAAYEAAQAITDEKAKAQALLDVVNEIDYFTQSH